MFKILVVRCKVDHRQSNELMDVGLGNGNKEGIKKEGVEELGWKGKRFSSRTSRRRSGRAHPKWP